MQIETVEELADQIADWIGVYEGCRNVTSEDNNCTYDKNKPLCCRTGFVRAISERIREAAENEKRFLRRDPCKYCHKTHGEYACDHQLEFLKKKISN